MSDASEAPAPAEAARPDPLYAHIVYGLYAAGFISAISPIAGIIVAHLKCKDYEGTYLESHFIWQIRTFWIALAAGVIGTVLMLLAVGFLILLATALWFLYRLVKGWLLLADEKPIDDPRGWI